MIIVNSYTKLGFKLEKVLSPDYKYVNSDKREHKFGYRKHILMKKYPHTELTKTVSRKPTALVVGGCQRKYDRI